LVFIAVLIFEQQFSIQSTRYMCWVMDLYWLGKRCRFKSMWGNWCCWLE